MAPVASVFARAAPPRAAARAAAARGRRRSRARRALAAASEQAPGGGGSSNSSEPERNGRLHAAGASGGGDSHLSTEGAKTYGSSSTSFVRVADLPLCPVGDEPAADEAMRSLAAAQEAFLELGQEEVDSIAHAVAAEANTRRVELARLAVDETQMGLMEDKVVKNHFAAEYVLAKHRDTKTVGIIDAGEATGVSKTAYPVGPIASLVPVTNPTSTVIFDVINAMKTRNTIIFLPHPRAARVSWYAVRLLAAAAEAAGAPPGCVQCVHPRDIALSDYVMRAEAVKFIIATGGNKMVKAALAVGKPAVSVGAGNCAAIVDETADLDAACSLIVTGKTFDNGVICATEQATVVVQSVAEEVRKRFERRGVHFVVDPAERKRLADTFYPGGRLNTEVVGKSAKDIAAMADIYAPDTCVVLAVDAEEIGPSEPFSYEKLCPIMALYKAGNFDDALRIQRELAMNGGLGHTCALHTDPDNKERIDQFQLGSVCMHNLVNTPSSLGAIGGPYNMALEPSLTLGTGTVAGSTSSMNMGPLALLNYKHTAERREHIEWFKVPPSVYFNRHCTGEALKDLASSSPLGWKNSRVLVVTDPIMCDIGLVDPVVAQLKNMGMQTAIFSDIAPDPDVATIREGVRVMERFNPDVVVGLGGGSVLDAAKIMRIMHEHPELTIAQMSMRFIEIRQRVCPFPKVGSRVRTLVLIPTTSGTGAEMTPFAVITDEDGVKYPITSYKLLPDCAVVDPQLALSAPRGLAANTGLDALTHALESLVSVYASDFTVPLSLKAARGIMEHLPLSVHTGHFTHRAACHRAASIAGMAFGNAFLGIAHSLAHQLGAAFHIPHGQACAMVISHVIHYNATDSPTRMAVFSQYTHPVATHRYAQLATQLGLATEDGPTDEQALVFALIGAIEALKADVGVPGSLRDAGVDEETFLARVDEMAERAFDDQCTGTNPRYPLVSELRQLLVDCYYGPPQPPTKMADAQRRYVSQDQIESDVANDTEGDGPFAQGAVAAKGAEPSTDAATSAAS